ncbi:CRTAC1 family protein [Sinimarinibacterium flocculans]|uniref:CRTAC1 family protein n=1 Tax=Sinimarinibacterium flocculans TaxID=985250 RepID=UPI0035127EDD
MQGRRSIAAVFAAAWAVFAGGCGSSSTPGPAVPDPVPTACDPPALKAASPGDAQADAAGLGQMFEQIELAGLTDIVVEAGTGGLATADLNGDGLPDLFAVSEEGLFPDALRLYVNQGCWQFVRETVTLINPDGLPEGNHAIPVFADFNGDGLLDFYLTGDPATLSTEPHPNMLFLARGDYRSFEEVGRRMGVASETAYSRQSAVADIDGDGWLDIAVAADQIGDRTFRPGVPWQRLFLYRPASGSSRFEDGHFEDIGGTPTIPGFGGEPTSDPEHDRASPSILLRDIDEDGDIDLVQSYHVDMLFSQWFHPHATGENHHGVFVWKNRRAQTGALHFEQELPGTGGLAEEGWSRYSVVQQQYVPVQHAIGLPYLSAADVDNDDDLDLLAVGPTDTGWHVHTDQIAAKFWRNEGNAGFRSALDEIGLGALDWGYGEWFAFMEAEPPPLVDTAQAVVCATSNQKPKCLAQSPAEHSFYHADSVWADFDNDGWIDLLAVDRRENQTGYGKLRNMLFMNRGDGRFELKATGFSGIDENSIAAEAADLNGDGLLDLYLMKDVTNSSPFSRDDGRITPHSEFTDSVFWNTGVLGGRDNHWVIVRLSGLPHGRLVGAKLRLRDAQGCLLGRRDLFPVTSYKTSVHLEAHFGLGRTTSPRLEIELPDGGIVQAGALTVDAVVEVDVATGNVSVVRRATGQRAAEDAS